MLIRILVALVVLAAAPTFEPLSAQGPGPSNPRGEELDRRPRAYVGGALAYAAPRGDFQRYVNRGWGIDLHARYALDRRGIVSLRGDAGVVEYGRESRTVCMAPPVGCRIVLDLTTANDIFTAGIGPEFGLPGRQIRPYTFATVGFAYFSTTSSVGGTGDHEDFAQTENFGDGTLAWTIGTGMQIQLTRGRHPLALDLGADYHGNGEVEYLREGDIVDEPDGSITLHPRRSRANFTVFRVGVTVGIPRNEEGGRRSRGGPPW